MRRALPAGRRGVMKRIHELAKEQNVESADIIDVLKRAGLPESKCTPSSTISPEWERRLMPLFDRLREKARRKAAQAESKAKRGSRKRATSSSRRTKSAASTKKKAATKKKASTRKTAARKKSSSTRKKTTSRSKTAQPKRWTLETVEAAAPSRKAADAWEEIERAEEQKRREKAEKHSAKRQAPEPAQPQPSAPEPVRPPTPEEIVAAAGIPVTHTAGRIPQLIAEEPDFEPLPLPPVRTPRLRRAETTPSAEVVSSPGTSSTEKARKATKKRAPRTREREISESARQLAERLGTAATGARSSVSPPPSEIEEFDRGASLLGDVPETEETIETAYGAVAEFEEPAVEEGPSGRKAGKAKGRAARPGVREGFERGRGFSLGPAQVAPGAPTRPGRGGRGRRGKKYFAVGGGNGRGRGRGRGRSARPSTSERPSTVEIAPPVTIKELSAAIGVRVPDIIRYLMKQGKMLRQNDVVDEDLALEIGLEFDVEVNIARKKEAGEELLAKILESYGEDSPDDLQPRAPVITILGHVDHGKTTLLDRIRKASVAQQEAGGITQHIGAYKVQLDDERSVVFVDTPGHEAFTEMRARGANVTDVVVLVVAADDGVMPQTEEAYAHAKAAGVPIVVALNKVDKPDANPMRAKQQLAGLGLQPVEWGGDTEVIEVSALKGTGIDELLETLWLQAEILELKANPNRPAEGTCLEARKTEGRGIVADMLVQRGTLRRGDVLVCGVGYGRVRAMRDDRGQQLEAAGPSTPVEVIGLEGLPEAGARFYVLPELSQAKEIAEQRQHQLRQKELAERRMKTPTRLEDVYAQLQAGTTEEIRVVLKTDVRGSLEVLKKELEKLATDEVRVRVLHGAVGGINESDVLLADASDAIIIGFNVAADERAREQAEAKGVEIRTYRVIYNVLEDLKLAMEGLLAPETQEEVIGDVEVRRIFKSSAVGTIAGCYVTKGRVTRGAKVRLIRNGVIVHEGELSSLKRHKDDVKEVREGFECGLTIKDYQDIHEGDRLQVYEIKLVARSLA
ncbi:MAG: translation initiation factor IF-2 [Planctomycetota bacterium]|nr:MAG: translation initiation factor IF-2 [Planctomycetota bacterium]